MRTSATDPTISVALATCNGERFLQAQLDSLAAQTRPPVEIVVCDDRSDDGTFALLEHFTRSSSVPVRLYRNSERLGWRENFQRCAARTDGDWIAFCDQDDVWRPDKLQRIAEAVGPSTSLVFHGAATIDDTGRRTGRLDRGPSVDTVWAPLSAPWWRTPLGFSMALRRDLVRHVDLWRDSIDQTDPAQCAAHDQWYWFLGAVFGRTVFLHDELVEYRLHGGNAMGHSTGGPSARDLVAIARATAEKCRRKVEVLDNRIELLRRIAPADVDEQEAIGLALVALIDVRRFDEQRLAMLDATRPTERVRRLAGLLRSRHYRASLLPEGSDERKRDVLAFVAGWGR